MSLLSLRDIGISYPFLASTVVPWTPSENMIDAFMDQEDDDHDVGDSQAQEQARNHKGFEGELGQLTSPPDIPVP
jgi:hypothetical protein